MTSDNKKLGQIGETAAISFLQSKGFVILETNYLTKPAEIDIIANDNGCICFIEVKTRTSFKKGLPRGSVNYSKQKKIITGSQFYLKENNLLNSKIRFDVIEVLKNRNNFSIKLTDIHDFAFPKANLKFIPLLKH